MRPIAPRPGADVYKDGRKCGTVTRVFRRAWAPHKGDVQSIRITHSDVVIGRIRLHGVLYWNRSRGRWVNRMDADAMYDVV